MLHLTDVMRFFMSFLFLAGILTIMAPQAGAESKIDNQQYAELLNKHARDGLVDYASFKTEHPKLKAYLAYLARIDPDDLSRDDAFAYYINLYNAATIDLVLENYPGIDSIKDIGGFFGNPWKIEFILLKGKKVHLDHVEHEILGPQYRARGLPLPLTVPHWAVRRCTPNLLRAEPWTQPWTS